MRKALAITGLLALGLFSSAAVAAGWSDFEAAFPVAPCHDGWVGCIVDGKVVTPDMMKDGTGAPMPADLRVGWFDLEGTASFSPFPALSLYTGELAVADAGGDDPPPADDTGTPSGGGDPNPAPSTGGGSSGGSSGGSTGGTTSGGSTTTGGSGGSTGGSTGGTADNTPDPSTGGGTSLKELANGGGTAEGGSSGNAIIQQSLQEQPTASGGGDCSNYKKLEPKAMMGKLGKDQTQCLEELLAAAPKQTEKNKISRVLMTNAYASGDKKSWEKLVKRHLDEIDRSDPDICYKYALHLAKKGPGASYGVIKWADVALENRTVWTGSTYTNRVNSLYKLRAIASQRLWQVAEQKMASDASDANRAERDKARNMTKVMAREWYEYAKSAGKDASKAKALCISAAGTEDYCEGA